MILDKLRKTVELKRLTEELSFTSVTGYPASYSHNGLSSQGSAGRPCRLPNLEDYEIIGFRGYVCNVCLVDHPLAIYRHKRLLGARAVHTFHVCSTDRITKLNQEQQGQHQEIDRDTTIANLYAKELPKSMLQAVKEWTSGCALLMTCKISGQSEALDFIPFTEKQPWVARAVKEGSTTLTDEELSDFIFMVSDTFLIGKIEQKEKNKGSEEVYFMALSNGTQLKSGPILF